MATWDPSQYRRFAGERFRPGYELMSRLGAGNPRALIDLGCGTGELTVELCRRYPAAKSQGLDSSHEMLQKAKQLSSHVEWIPGDIAAFGADSRFDLVFTNAALQWIGHHEALLPRLISSVASGGVFAMQVPSNFDAPSHVLIAESLREMKADASFLQRNVLEPERYVDFLQASFDETDVWCTEYVHLLKGEDAVLEWVRGTALRPLMTALSAQDFSRFVEIYRDKLRNAYPVDAQGATRFPFRRLFAVGRGRH